MIEAPVGYQCPDCVAEARRIDGYIHVKDIQLEGKKRMSVEDFLRGYRF